MTQDQQPKDRHFEERQSARPRVPWLAVRVLLVVLSAAMLGAAVVTHPNTTQAGASHLAMVPSASTAVILAAGDIACDPTDRSYNGGKGTKAHCQELWTAAELNSNAPTAVLPLGDNQYNCGTLSAFNAVYGPTWGQEKGITHPVVGNHEYLTNCSGAARGAAGYFSYFGAAATPLQPSCTAGCKGYYSYNLGAWHIIALNSECGQVGGCGAGSAQESWLRKDLSADTAVCTLAYWHRPFYSAGQSAGDASMQTIFTDLYNAHVSLVLNGHDHNYQRYAPQDANGNASSRGVTEIVAGTGGESHLGFNGTPPNLVIKDNTTYGVLKLVLNATSYSWQFIPDGHSGTFTDAGSAACV